MVTRAIPDLAIQVGDGVINSHRYKQDDGTVVERRYSTDEYGRLTYEAPDLPQPVQALPV